MVLATLAVLAILVLAIVGIGVVPFFTGVYKGGQLIASNPTVKEMLSQSEQSLMSLLTGLATQK